MEPCDDNEKLEDETMKFRIEDCTDEDVIVKVEHDIDEDDNSKSTASKMEPRVPLMQNQRMSLLNLIKENDNIVTNKSTAPGIFEVRSTKRLKRSYDHVKREVKDEDRNFKRKVKVTGAGQPPTLPKATEEIVHATDVYEIQKEDTSMARRQGLDTESYLKLLEDFPSDYDTDTDVEPIEDSVCEDDQGSPKPSHLTSDPLDKAQGTNETRDQEHSSRTTDQLLDLEHPSTSTNEAEIPTSSEESRPSVSGKGQQSKRRWKKKPEASQNIHACGTIRSTRKDFPTLASDKELKRGQFDYRSTPNGITVYKWKDSKAVHMASNYHGNVTTTVKRREKDGSRSVVPCPQVIKDYNENMGGVDKHDMLRQLYGMNRKSMKWWHRIFFGLLDMSIVNAFVVYKEHHGSLPLLEFRRELAQGLMTFAKDSKGAPKRKKIDYSIPTSVRLNNTGIHWPKFIQKKGRCEQAVFTTSKPSSPPASRLHHQQAVFTTSKPSSPPASRLHHQQAVFTTSKPSSPPASRLHHQQATE
ncbi:hypothetical protein Pmani_015818 [Petrolisthes manimaculis]|uniref:PiggyBac transposable element-derived protein domain-containing protein n=1 Tax=Petrolisthes manimaculis TaxID=1843537 RepID=A0AAE1PRM0_9EUCA|nr:hypothetical protein Pmani_015818 [Petrolisthes manimaculis]